MTDEGKAGEQLLTEMARLRQKVSQLEASASEHSKVGEALRHCERKLRSLVEQSEDGIVLTDGRGMVVEWSPGQERITGIRRTEAVGRALWDVHFQMALQKDRTPATYQQCKARIFELLRTGKPPRPGRSEEREIERTDGARRVVRSVLFPIRTQSGWLAGSICRDITGRPTLEQASILADAPESRREETAECRRVENELRESLRRYALATAAAKVGVWDWNPETDEIYLDPSLKAMLGYEDHEIRNHLDDWHKLVHPDDAARVAAEADEHRKGLTLRYQSIHRLLHRDGSSRWFLARGTTLRRADGKPYRVVGAYSDITGQKRAEEALRRTHDELEALVQERTATLLQVKAKLEQQVTGRQRAEEALQEARDELEEAVHERTAQLARANQLLKEEIGERKRPEEWVQRERDDLTAIFDALEDGVCLVDEKHDVEYANASLKEQFGPFDGEKCYHYLHGREDVCPWCPNQRVFAGETVRRERYCSQSQRTYAFIDAPVKRSGGAVSKLAILRDVTERKGIEDALRQSEANWQSLVKNAPDMILTVDREGKILFINRTPAGMTVEDALGRSIIDCVRDSQRSAARESLQRVFRTGQAEYCEIAARGPYGSTSWYATRLGPIKRDGEVVSVMLVARDITERRRARDQLRKAHDELEVRVYERTAALLQANAQLEQEIAERKRAEEEILAYQEKLRSLGSQLQLAEERERRHIATDLHDQIGQTLALCRIKMGSLREAAATPGLAQSLDEMRAMMETAIAYTRSLTYQLSPPILYELGFEAAVEWLCEDLLERHGVTCRFEIGRQPKPLDDDVRVLLFRAVRELLVNVAKHAQASSAEVSVRRDGQEIRIVVKDDGIGFDASRTVATTHERGGFGLFLYHERLSHLGGRLEVESSPGKGTRVTLVAPLKRDEEARREESHEHSGSVG